MIYQGRMLHGETEATSSVLRHLRPRLRSSAAPLCGLTGSASDFGLDDATAAAEADSTVFRAYSGGDSHMSAAASIRPGVRRWNGCRG